MVLALKRWTDYCLVAVYCLAIVLANGLVTSFGQAALPYTAFFLIPFDLVVRDLLQDRWQWMPRLALSGSMALLVLGGSTLSYITIAGSYRIAIASFVAFATTGFLDALTYQVMIRWGRLFRINLATLLAALIDSVIFAIIAFEEVDNPLVVAQIATKIAGGFVWSLLLFRFFKRRRKCLSGD